MKKESVMKRNFFDLNKSKYGQVSVFIIIAVVLVAVSGVALFVTKDANRPDDSKFFSQLNSKPEFSNIRSAILSCRDTSVKASLDTIGIQGGYSDKPQKSIDLGWTFIPYYYMEGKYAFPNLAFIEKELGKQIDKDFTKCIDDLEFENFAIENTVSKTKATIKRSEVSVKIDMPISIKKEDGTVVSEDMKNAPTVINSSLFEIIEISGYITESHKNDSKMICVTCVADMAEERDLYVNSFSLVNNSVLYVISENHTSDETYSFEFLNKYPEPELVDVTIPSVPVAPNAAG